MLQKKFLEKDGELIKDEEGEFIHLKFIVSVLTQKVVWFSAQYLHPTFLFLQSNLIMLPKGMNAKDISRLSDNDKWRLLVTDKIVGGDIFVSPDEKVIRIFLGFSGIEHIMKKEKLFHSKKTLDQALEILAKDLEKSDLDWKTAKVEILAKRKYNRKIVR